MKTEPNKLETQIKEQINARKIQPSEMAWDRLDAMLSVAEEKKTTRLPFLSSRFIGIAASVLVLVSLGLFFFNPKENVAQPDNKVVVKEKSNNKINNNDKVNDNSLNTSKQKQQVAEIKNQQSKIGNQKSSPSFNLSTNRQVINQKTSGKPIINPKQEVFFSKQEAVAQKELPEVSSEKPLASKPSTVNVDELLASVEKTPKLNAKSKVKVNANSLLSQVDGELDQSFRDKVLNKINKNYKEVKVALATRNQQ